MRMGSQKRIPKNLQLLILLCTVILLILTATSAYYRIENLRYENYLLQRKIENLKEEKRWIWRNEVTSRIEFGETRIEWESNSNRIVIPVMGLNEENETLFVANASLPFRTENCDLFVYDGRMIAYAVGDIQQLNQQIDSLRADWEFYKQQYDYYYRKYVESQPKGLQLLISNRTAFMALWNTSVSLTVSNVRYEIPLYYQNRNIPLEIEYYNINKTYGYCVIEVRNFTFINHASFPVLPLEMVNGTYAWFEWMLISEDETKCVIQQSLRLVNVTFTDGITYRHVDLTLNHMIHKSEGDP